MVFKELDHVIDMGMQEKKLVGGTGFASFALLQALLEPLPESVSFLRIVDVTAQMIENGRDIAFEINVQKARDQAPKRPPVSKTMPIPYPY